MTLGVDDTDKIYYPCMCLFCIIIPRKVHSSTFETFGSNNQIKMSVVVATSGLHWWKLPVNLNSAYNQPCSDLQHCSHQHDKTRNGIAVTASTIELVQKKCVSKGSESVTSKWFMWLIISVSTKNPDNSHFCWICFISLYVINQYWNIFGCNLWTLSFQTDMRTKWATSPWPLRNCVFLFFSFIFSVLHSETLISQSQWYLLWLLFHYLKNGLL